MDAGQERKTIFKVAAALLGLLALTVGLSFVDLGSFNFPAALLIASAKAILVVLFFMELRASSRLVWVMAGLGFFWLFLLIGGTLNDYMTRSTLRPPEEHGALAAQPTDEPWAAANPEDPRNSGDLGPGGSNAPDGIGPTEKSGTPGEPVSTKS